MVLEGKALGTIVTMVVQACSSIVNQRYSKKSNDEIRKKQQESKVVGQKNSLKRDYEKFKRSCEFQIQMENESHLEKLKSIQNDLENTFNISAYKAALTSHYPLRISPYIISKSVITYSGLNFSQTRKEVFCFLTNSNDKAFNKEIVPTLDDLLCEAVSSFWNQGSMHTMCYYTGIWNESILYCDEDIDNIKALITTPTLTVTPFFQKLSDGASLMLKLHLWGIGEDVKCATVDTGVSYKELPKIYTDEQVKDVINSIFGKLLCSIGTCIDTYYWASYYQKPLLPELLSSNKIDIGDSAIQVYSNAYFSLFNKIVLGDSNDNNSYLDNSDSSIINDVAQINLFNFPERSVSFLESISRLPGFDHNDIRKILLAIASARAGSKQFEIDSILFEYSDIPLLKQIYDVAVYCNNAEEISFIEHLISDILKNTISFKYPGLLRKDFHRNLLFCDDEVPFTDKYSWAVNIIENLDTDYNMSPTIVFHKMETNSLLHVLKEAKSTCIDSPDFDRLIVYVDPRYFCVVSAFTNSHNGRISHRNPISCYFSKHFITPDICREQTNKICIEINSLEQQINKLNNMMTERDIENLFNGKSESNDSIIKGLVDAFFREYHELKQRYVEELKNIDKNHTPTITKSTLQYEDLTSWIRSNSTSASPFNGVFATIEKSGLFDREEYKMYVCFTIDNKPQIQNGCPRVIFEFSKLDDTLKDMFNKNTALQIKLNRK